MTALHFIFAHGAGAGIDSEWMQTMTELLRQNGVCVHPLQFEYMNQMAQTGKRRPPSRAHQLLDEFRAKIAALNAPCVIGGKSMGGRMASLLAASADAPLSIKGVLCFGYPFHPRNKPETRRTEHLGGLPVPLCVVQGTRDPMGSLHEVSAYGLTDKVQLHWLDDGDHDLTPRRASGRSAAQYREAASDYGAAFIARCLSSTE